MQAINFTTLVEGWSHLIVFLIGEHITPKQLSEQWTQRSGYQHHNTAAVITQGQLMGHCGKLDDGLRGPFHLIQHHVSTAWDIVIPTAWELVHLGVCVFVYDMLASSTGWCKPWWSHRSYVTIFWSGSKSYSIVWEYSVYWEIVYIFFPGCLIVCNISSI